jgi:hypothetical protein
MIGVVSRREHKEYKNSQSIDEEWSQLWLLPRFTEAWFLLPFHATDVGIIYSRSTYSLE